MSFAPARLNFSLTVLLALAVTGALPATRAELGAEAVQELIESAPTATEVALLQQIYSDNPAIAQARALAAARAERGPQVGTLPDPTLGLAAFLLPPETRTGPQRVTATLGQRIPWKGKLSLREDVQRALAAEARARAEQIALTKISQARRLLTRIAFIDVSKQILDEDLATLEEFERLARARYATGRGPAQSPIKLQAEITRDRTRLLDLDRERAELVTQVNALRDRPGSEELPPLNLPDPRQELPSPEQLQAIALARHPAVAGGRKAIASTEHRVALARKDYRPDFSVGMTYTVVDRRQDWAGRVAPPADSGQDILGVAATINLPIRKRRLDAGVREALEARTAATADLASTVLDIERQLHARLAEHPPLLAQWHLLGEVLLPQAEESLASVRFGYETGISDVLDLLDAERILLEVRLGTKRAAMQLQLLIIDIEEAIAGPLAIADEGDQA